MPRSYFKLLPKFPKSGGSIKEFDDWDKKLKAEYPVRFKLNTWVETIYQQSILFPMWRVREAKWWLYYRVHPKYNKSHKIDIKSLQPGYHDPLTLILHAPFDCFCQFVDKIYNGDSYVLWEVTPGERYDDVIGDEEIKRIDDRWNEMQVLYRWWMIDRPNREDIWYEKNPRVELPEEWGTLCMFNDDYRDTPEVKAWSEHAKRWNLQEGQWDLEDEAMLIRLAKIRHYLWD